MTNEEAKDVFKELKITTCEGKLCITTTPTDLVNASDIAIEALEKQIPKKPDHRKDVPFDVAIGFCPKCGNGINEEMKYCDRCGQRLDWSKDET